MIESRKEDVICIVVCYYRLTMSVEAWVEELEGSCPLVQSKTHYVRRREDDVVFVVDAEFTVPFGQGNAIQEAEAIAQSSLDAKEGCSGCCLFRKKCHAIPVALSLYPEANALVPALRTSGK